LRKRSPLETRIYILFFLSGISGLVYEVIWLRILTRVLGCTVYATSVILAAFMAGLALGSYLSGRLCNTIKNKLRLYAFLEISVGVSALLLTLFLKELTPLYKTVYAMVGGSRFSLTLIQSTIMFVILLVPTSLMGATLPILSSHTKRYEADFSGRTSRLYGLNTLGAFIGVIASGFFLIGSIGESSTLMTAVLINLAVAFLAFLIVKDESVYKEASPELPASEIAPSGSGPLTGRDVSTRRLVLVAYGLIGFAAMSYEIIWSRMFQVEVGTSVYAFSLMLAFYLSGIAAGSIWGAKLIGKIKKPLNLIVILQFFIALYGICGMYLFTLFPPFDSGERIGAGSIFIMPPLIVFPVTFASGLIFPLLLRFYVRNETDVAGDVGRIYAVNTIGCIVGSLVCGFILIGTLGTRGTLIALSVLQAIVGIMLLSRIPVSAPFRNRRNIAVSIVLALTVFLGAFAPDPFFTLAKKVADKWRKVGRYSQNALRYFHREGVAATTTALWLEGVPQAKALLINGVGVTAPHTETKLMAHIPLILHEDPKDMLIICFGMGTTLRSAWTYKSLGLDVVEIVPDTYESFKYFYADAARVLADPRVSRYVDDGRNFLLTRDKKYDVITMDPSPPIWSAGTVNLYTKEFFELCKGHLNPDGIMCLWIQPAEYSEIVMIMKTFISVFPRTYVFSGKRYAGFYMIGLTGEKGPDLGRFERMRNNKAITADLTELNMDIPDAGAIPPLLIFGPEQVDFFTQGIPVIVDDYPYTEFPLWRSLFEPLYNITLDASVASHLLEDTKRKMGKK
jgi:spermidine synthase